MEDELVIVGVGSGNPDYIIPEALKQIREAEIVVGSHRLLQGLTAEEQLIYELSSDFEALRLNLPAWEGRKVAFIVSGDPGFYSILEWIKRELPGKRLKVIPGISSMQLAFARAARSWFDYKFTSLHGRTGDLAAELRKHPKLCLLTDSHNRPRHVLQMLKNSGIRRRWVFVGSNLGTPEEVVWEGYLDGDLESTPDEAYSVVIIEDEALGIRDPGHSGRTVR